LNQFKSYVARLESGKFIFRGHRSNGSRLRTSFHRTGRANWDRFLLVDVPSLSKTFSALTRHVFDLSDPRQHGALVSLAQHHGYPTPLLDWTRSPYVAVYFAYRNIERSVEKSRKKTRIYVFDVDAWQILPQLSKIGPAQPHVSVLDLLAIENPRMIPQQAISTVTNVDDIEGHIKTMETATNKTFLTVIDLPEREQPSDARPSYDGYYCGFDVSRS
jgi:hypothetical protein